MAGRRNQAQGARAPWGRASPLAGRTAKAQSLACSGGGGTCETREETCRVPGRGGRLTPSMLTAGTSRFIPV